MKVAFQYTKQEYARAFWMNCKRALRPKLDAFAGAAGVALGAWLLNEGETLWGCLILGVMGLFIVLLLSARFIIPNYIYNQHIINRGQYFIEFTEEGIQFKACNIDSKLDWSIYKHALASSEHYLLYFGKNQYTIIPLRIFESADRLKAFDLLIWRKIKDVKTV